MTHQEAGPHDGGTHDGSVDHQAPETGTSDAPADVAHDAFTCDGTQPPSVAACVISETYGVFVAPAANGGSDTTGMGTRSLPYATITKALSSLGSLSRVYVCNGSYTDRITVSATVSIFGGLTCGAAADAGAAGPWIYASGTKATVAGSTPAFTLEVNAGSAAVDVEDMEFDAPAGTGASPSSIAVFATESTNVSMRTVTLTAAAGFAGTSGVTGSNYAGVQANGGNQASAATGATSQSCTCGDASTSVGGRGGQGDPTAPGAGSTGSPTISGAPATAGAPGTYNTLMGQCENGNNGASSSNGAGGPGATSAGTLTSSGWTLGPVGISGTNAGVAQGGGGGSGGIYVVTASGGGGGGACGGCGGGGGSAGGAGGSSFALVSVGSTVTLDGCVLTAGAGGQGGAGGNGQTGEPGGAGGIQASGGCPGGGGGKGGNGGGGGGGAGGLSIAIAYSGIQPMATNGSTTTAAATAATGGIAGTGGTPVATAGSAGVTQATMSF
jgi:hypothetical protein